MTDCTIHPIPLYKGERDKSLQVYRLDVGQTFTLASYAWYIEGPKEKILVDAGGSTEYMAKHKGRTAYKDIQTIETGLSKFGLSCEDINLVIFTHLHHDHTANAARFTNARFFTQKDELEFALNPHPFFTTAYHRPFFEGLNFEMLEGDAQIAEGVSVFRTPGHSIGGQSVKIKTTQGVAIIPGMCCAQENFEPQLVGSKLPVIPPTPHYDLLKVYDSMLKIKEVADIIVPNHDGKYLHINSIPLKIIS